MAEIISLTRQDRLASNCHVLISRGEAAVIDPSVSYDRVEEILNEHSAKLKYVLLTHAHADHVWEIDSYSRLGIPVIAARGGAEMLSDPRMNCSIFIGYKFSCDSPVRELSEGEGIKVGDELLTVMLTPGHTADSLVFYTSSYAFTGDTLFSEGGYGRCDLPTGSTSALAASLRRIFELSDELIIYPGHGNSSSLGSTKMYF